jgi:phage major head subunit gpT-like protein
MPLITPTFVYDLETRMRRITENEYLRLSASERLWWQKVAKVITSGTRREIIWWVLSTAQLQDQGQGGNIAFDDMYVQSAEYVARTAGKGFKLRRQQFEDQDGNGVQLATEWSLQMGAQHSYWPQKSIAALMKVGESTLAYDGKNFFAKDHPVNPFNLGAGTYANLFSGAAASTPATDPNDAVYPGACPIDDSVTADVALANLAKVYSYIASIRMPNGNDPRGLRPAGIMAGPRLFPRAVQLSSAKFLAMAAGAAAAQGGSTDVEGLIKAMGYGMPIQADEFAGFESDTSYYVLAEQIGSSQLGALAYVDREAFSIRYYTGRGGGNGVDAILDRADELEWHTSGRNVAAFGHPWLLFKVRGT